MDPAMKRARRSSSTRSEAVRARFVHLTTTSALRAGPGWSVRSEAHSAWVAVWVIAVGQRVGGQDGHGRALLQRRAQGLHAERCRQEDNLASAGGLVVARCQ